MKRRQLQKDNKGMKGAIEAIIALFVVLFLVLVLVNVSNILYTSEIPAQAQDQGIILFASDYAESGNGTSSNPYVGGVHNAIDDLPNGKGMVFIDGVHRVDKAIYMVSTYHSDVKLVGSGGSSLLKAKDQAYTTLSQNANIGDTILHVASTSGFTIGEWIEIVDCDTPAGNEEAKYISSLDSSASTITLTVALTDNHVTGEDVFSTWSTIWVNGVSDVTLSNFAIDGNQAKWVKTSVLGCNHQYEIDEHSCRNLRIENIDIVNSKRIGIRLLAGTESVIVTGCYLKDCSKAGICAQGNFDECIISNNQINGAVTKGIELEDGHNILIEGNVINSTEQAIFFYGGVNSRYVTISNNVLYSDLRIYKAKYVDAIGNVLIDTNNGISIGGTVGEYCEHISIVGNTLYSLQGISAVSYSRYVTIQGNTIHGSNPASVDCFGINLGATSTYNTVIGNTIFEARYGIRFYSGHNIISGNSISSCGHSSISDQVSDSTNIIRANDGYVTEKSGSATMLNGQTSITVTYGMDVTPTSITVTGNHSEVSSCWITSITSTQFTINVSGAVTTDRTVYWYAEAR